MIIWMTSRERQHLSCVLPIRTLNRMNICQIRTGWDQKRQFYEYSICERSKHTERIVAALTALRLTK